MTQRQIDAHHRRLLKPSYKQLAPNEAKIAKRMVRLNELDRSVRSICNYWLRKEGRYWRQPAIKYIRSGEVGEKPPMFDDWLVMCDALLSIERINRSISRLESKHSLDRDYVWKIFSMLQSGRGATSF